MAVYENYFWVSQNVLSKARLNVFLLGNHYKIICRPVRTECSSAGHVPTRNVTYFAKIALDKLNDKRQLVVKKTLKYESTEEFFP